MVRPCSIAGGAASSRAYSQEEIRIVKPARSSTRSSLPRKNTGLCQRP